MQQNPTNRSDYNYFTKMGTRWNDNDIYGHLNNVIYYGGPGISKINKKPLNCYQIYKEIIEKLKFWAL